ncbi:P-loop containing nucleoside triphosphate hydrolase protein [Podospora aff. communis PSN243]|uniref:P-loop containing nucleoside triphosphate hydrolase protein n=1 Tax=Podospora aff. communis PSN243 TaxID=3040156 RepID=A0AAV9GS22_9PEZI|nr:P-loop containing nucleoside triphosphate hydrolase protein [Podospora aff. communis PSN243]
MIGLEEAKKTFRTLGKYVQAKKILGIDPSHGRFHAVFQGNPGTGKTTVARLYAKFLHALGILPSDKFVETSGAKLASEGPTAVTKIFGSSDDDSDSMPRHFRRMHPDLFSSQEESEPAKGGVLFVDEAYQLVSPHSANSGKQVLDLILSEMDHQPTKWVIIFAGYKNDLEAFFAHNDGLMSRIPYVLDFKDFREEELRCILLHLIDKRFNSVNRQCEIEDGPDGLYIKTAIRRLSSGRGRRGFGNARSVQDLLFKICQRQAQRLLQASHHTPTAEEFCFFTKEDLIGPSPSDIRSRSEAWAKLRNLIGLEHIKTSMDSMLGMVEENHQRELRGLKPFGISLNRVFVGSPGTGKTTVAELYGQILAELGFLSNGSVVLKNPSDFIGDAVGKSESKTKAILASTVGKVLVIDEAYMLDPGDSTQSKNSYKTAVLDLIVAEVQGNPGDDRCVVLLGYEHKMQSLFRNANPGLCGRFMAHSPFRFPDYSMKELREILHADLANRDLACAAGAMDAAMGVLARLKKYVQDFSNARQVKSLVSDALLNYQARQMQLSSARATERFNGILLPEDFDPRLSPSAIATEVSRTCREILSPLGISTAVIEQLERLLPRGWGPGSRNRDPLHRVPRTLVLKGPPGTGKSTVAQQLGPLFYNTGLLLSGDVIERSAADLIGQHVGHTIPKTRDLLRFGIGKVLVLHDIHRLASGGYASEAVDELISFVRINSRRMVVVLTGLEKAVGDLMKEKPELGSLFPVEITFENLSPDECLILLDKTLKQSGVLGSFLTPEGSKQRLQKALAQLMISQIPYETWDSVPITEYVEISEEAAMECIKETFRIKNRRAKKAGVGEAKEQIVEKADKGKKGEGGKAKVETTQAAQESKPNKEEEAEKQEVDHKKSKGKDKSRTVAEVLKGLGQCEKGFDWVRDGNGYRCKGGSHYMSDAQIEAHM